MISRTRQLSAGLAAVSVIFATASITRAQEDDATDLPAVGDVEAEPSGGVADSPAAEMPVVTPLALAEEAVEARAAAEVVEEESVSEGPAVHEGAALVEIEAGADIALPALPNVQLHLDFAAPPPVAMRPWAAPFALVPGLGLAHLIGGQRRTGLRLMAAGLGGLGAVVVGGGGIILSGASRRTILVFSSVALIGVTSFLIATIADLAGAISRGRLRGSAMERERFFLRGGLLYLVDPQFDYGPFLEAEGRARFGSVQLELGGSVAITHDNQRFYAGLRYFLSGAEARGTSSYLRTSLRYHRFGGEGFAHLTGEVAIGGRVELATFGPSLRGMFVEGEWGVGFQGFGFDATGGGVGNTTNSLLVLRGGIGVYLADRGEMSVYYDHRRDGFAGMMSLNSVAAGNVGHVGAEAHGYFGGGEWGLGGEIKLGSAWVTRLMLQRRWL